MSSPSWPYLPTNPCCNPQPCGCTDPCTNPCQTVGRRSDDLAYNGADLPCTGIDNCDTLTEVIQKIEAAICAIQAQLTTTTSTTSIPTTTTTTTTVMVTTTTTTTTVGGTTTTTTTSEPVPLVIYYSDFLSELCNGTAEIYDPVICSLTGDTSLIDGHTYYWCGSTDPYDETDNYYSNTTGPASVIGMFDINGVWTAFHTCSGTTTTTSSTTLPPTTTTTSTTVEPTTTTTTSSTTSSTTTTTTTEEPLPEEIWLDLTYLAVDIPFDDELDYRFVIKNGTSNTYVTAVRVMNITKSSGWIFINTQPSHAGDIDYYSGKTSSLIVTNENGDEYEMQFSTDGGATWTATIYNGTGTLPWDADL